MKISIIGAGNFGTAIALLASHNQENQITLFDRDKDKVNGVNQEKRNLAVYPNFILPDNIQAKEIFDDSILESELIFVALSSNSLRDVLTQIKIGISSDSTPIVINLSKGIEGDSLKVPSQIFFDVFETDISYGTLAGPNFALEIMKQDPTASVIASKDPVVFEKVGKALSSEYFRPYSSGDVMGVELLASLKNVIAIASGIHESLGFGKNSKAALITRGLIQMSRIVLKAGGQIDTVVGLSGVGDLVLTATSDLSRNYRLGILVGQGYTLQEALSEIDSTVEGVETVKTALLLAQRYEVELSIVEGVKKILFENQNPKIVLTEMMSRPQKGESLSL